MMDAQEYVPTRLKVWRIQKDMRHPPLKLLNEPVEEGRQRAAAAVRTMHPPSFLARISASLTQEKTSDIISDVRSLYVVPDGDQAPGVDSDGYRVGLKRKAAGISRSQYEVYSEGTWI